MELKRIFNPLSIATDLLFATDNANDIGAAASGRPRDVYVGRDVVMAAESWIGPSSTTGIYFKAGNVGIGTTGPGARLEVDSDILIKNTATAGEAYLVAQANVANITIDALGSTLGGTAYAGLTGNSQVIIEVNSASSFVFSTIGGGTTPPIIFAPGRVEKVRITNGGNVGIGTTTPGGTGTVGTAVLSLANGTAPVGGVANQVSLYSADVANSAELFALDEAGNAPQLSPHPADFLNTLPLEGREYPWAYSASNCYLGKQIDVDMMGAIRAVEKLSNKQFIFLSELSQDKRADWDTVQESQQKEREERIANLQRQIADLEQQILEELDEEKRTQLGEQRDAIQVPEPYQKKSVPQWMRARGVNSKV